MIRNKYPIIAIFIFGLILVFFIVTPYILGIVVEKAYYQKTNNNRSHSYASRKEDSDNMYFNFGEYHRGWFSSHATINVSVKLKSFFEGFSKAFLNPKYHKLSKQFLSDDLAKLKQETNVYINHGPVFLQKTFNNVGADFFGRLYVDGVSRFYIPMLSMLAGDDAEYVVKNKVFVPFAGKVNHTLSSKPKRYDLLNNKLDVGAVNIQATHLDDFSKGDVEGTIFGVNFVNNNVNMNVGDIKINNNWHIEKRQFNTLAKLGCNKVIFKSYDVDNKIDIQFTDIKSAVSLMCNSQDSNLVDFDYNMRFGKIEKNDVLHVNKDQILSGLDLTVKIRGLKTDNYWSVVNNLSSDLVKLDKYQLLTTIIKSVGQNKEVVLNLNTSTKLGQLKLEGRAKFMLDNIQTLKSSDKLALKLVKEMKIEGIIGKKLFKYLLEFIMNLDFDLSEFHSQTNNLVKDNTDLLIQSWIDSGVLEAIGDNYKLLITK